MGDGSSLFWSFDVLSLILILIFCRYGVFSPIYCVFLANIQSIFSSVSKTKQKMLGSAAQKFSCLSLFGQAETFFSCSFSLHFLLWSCNLLLHYSKKLKCLKLSDENFISFFFCFLRVFQICKKGKLIMIRIMPVFSYLCFCKHTCTE